MPGKVLKQDDAPFEKTTFSPDRTTFSSTGFTLVSTRLAGWIAFEKRESAMWSLFRRPGFTEVGIARKQ